MQLQEFRGVMSKMQFQIFRSVMSKKLLENCSLKQTPKEEEEVVVVDQKSVVAKAAGEKQQEAQEKTLLKALGQAWQKTPPGVPWVTP